MTSTSTTATEKDSALSAEVIGMLDLEPRRIRLLSAIHEAGHAVVANTIGALVISATVTSDGQIGNGDDHTHLDMPGGAEIPFPEHLTILAAGFQASYFWLRGRGFTDKATLNKALNILAGGDHNALTDLCERWDRPDVRMQDGALPAAKILARRWSTVLRIGYDLARLGTVRHAELWPHLIAGPLDLGIEAREVFQQWRNEFDPTHQYGDAR